MTNGCNKFHDCFTCPFPPGECKGENRVAKPKRQRVDIERKDIVKAVGKCGGVIEAAKMLGVKPHLVYARLAMRSGKTKATWQDVILVLKKDGDRIVVDSTNVPLDIERCEIRGKLAILA